MMSNLCLGYPKFCCFLCHWDSRLKKRHYKAKKWPQRKHFVIGKFSVMHAPLVSASKVIIPPMHIKLGLFASFVRNMDKDAPGYQFIRSKFPKMSDAKVASGAFTGPKIRKLMKDHLFTKALQGPELKVWNGIVAVCEGFLGNFRAKNYKVIFILKDVLCEP